MNSITVRTRVESETINLPELKQFMGKTVEIRVTEQPDPTADAEKWRAAAEAVAGLEDYDFEAWSDQRKYDLQNQTDQSG